MRLIVVLLSFLHLHASMIDVAKQTLSHYLEPLKYKQLAHDDHFCPQSDLTALPKIQKRSPNDELTDNIIYPEEFMAICYFYGAATWHFLHGLLCALYVPTFARVLPLLMVLIFNYMIPFPYRQGRIGDDDQKAIPAALVSAHLPDCMALYEKRFCPNGIHFKIFQICYVTGILQLLYCIIGRLTKHSYTKKIGSTVVFLDDIWNRHVSTMFIVIALMIIFDMYQGVRQVVPYALMPLLAIYSILDAEPWQGIAALTWFMLRSVIYFAFGMVYYSYFSSLSK